MAPAAPRTPRTHVKTLDWDLARARLASLSEALARLESPTPERARAILDSRAREMARRPGADDAAATIDAVIFTLDRERYAIETRHVLEILRFTAFTPVPRAPDFLTGLTNRRGEILAVVDLRRFFNIDSRSLSDLARVLVLGAKEAAFGVLADTVDDVRGIRLDAIQPAPRTVNGIGREYLKGVTADALIVLDGDALLNDPRLMIDQK
jgi:purine-binding chemotaxis protein CheW